MRKVGIAFIVIFVVFGVLAAGQQARVFYQDYQNFKKIVVWVYQKQQQEAAAAQRAQQQRQAQQAAPVQQPPASVEPPK